MDAQVDGDAKSRVAPSTPRRRRLAARLASLKWAAETVSAIVQVVAIIAAGIWAIYTFIYEDRIKPASEPPVLVATARIQKVGQRNGRIALQISSSIRNVGKGSLRLLTSVMNVYGLQVQTGTGSLAPRSTSQQSDVIDNSRDFRETAKTVLIAFGRRHKAAGGKNSDTFLDSGEEIVLIQDIIYVEPQKYDQVWARLRFDYLQYQSSPLSIELKTGPDGSVYPDLSKCMVQQDQCGISTEANAGLSLW